MGQVPPLQQRRLEVERDVERADDEVGQRQVGDEEVGDGAHPTAPHHHVDHQRVACEDAERKEEIMNHDSSTCYVLVVAGMVQANPTSSKGIRNQGK